MGISVSVTPRGAGFDGQLRIEVFGIRVEIGGLPAGGAVTVAGSGEGVGVRLAGPVGVAGGGGATGQSGDAVCEGPHPPAGPPGPGGAGQEALFQKLVALRARVSAEAGLPRYCVFQDATLREMSGAMPADLQWRSQNLH